MIERTLFNRLSIFAGLTGLVGTKIYPIVLPQDCQLPAITYRRVSVPPREPMISKDTGTIQPNFEITAWVSYSNPKTPGYTAYDQLCAIALQIRLALERWQDEANGIFDTYIQDETEDFNFESLCFYRVLTVEVVCQEETPE